MRKRADPFSTAKKYSQYLLYDFTYGNMGKELKPNVKYSVEGEKPTFSDKNKFLDLLIKLGTSENKVEEPEESPFEHLKEQLHGGKTSDDERDNGDDSDGGEGSEHDLSSVSTATTEKIPGEDLA
jgi:hypothetical protein